MSQFGATGDYPHGKMNEEDEGGLMMGITHDKGKVIINFGKPCDWIGMPPEQAFAFARLIAEHASAAMRDITETDGEGQSKGWGWDK
jgi:hypothetical protein